MSLSSQNLTLPADDAQALAWVDALSAAFARAGLYFGHGTTSADDEAAWLVAEVGGVDYANEAWPKAFDALMQRSLTDAERDRVVTLARRRMQERQPLAYLLGHAWFCGRAYLVDERVLVPRSPIGGLIADRFEPWLAGAPPRRALDLCTGSGCIAIAMAHEFGHCEIDATDLSADALDVAAQNVALHDMAGRVSLLQGDLFEAIPGQPRYDLIVTNPPYVDAEEMASRPCEFRSEPELGLAAGGDGLDVARRILSVAADYLAPDGLLVMEVGASDDALQAAYPTVPFTWWLSDDQGYGVLIIDRATLVAHADALGGS